jgi:hypothetical protein
MTRGSVHFITIGAKPTMPFRNILLSGAACVALLANAVHTALAAAPIVGSGNEAVIEPPAPHPAETPCVVTLASRATFGANAVPFSFTPPAACPGPWANVILSISISLNEGRQFDRTGALFLGGVPLWFGTTAEPRATLAPSWSFDRDVTQYTALFNTAQTGFLQIPNYQSTVYTSTITASATLSFYPATASAPAPSTADVVLPLPTGGGLATLNSGTDTAAFTGTLPTNILHAEMDVYLQGQSNDEFWYTCVPNAVSGALLSCGNSAFREGEITVDGTPAGVAPVYPWIFTGGIDPYLWQPIPGVQTFKFTPFIVDLSPFAGVLSNGQSHTIAASVFNANSYFSATGALRLFLDKNSSTVTGAVTRNTLAAPNPVVTTNITTSSAGASTGTVDITSAHDFSISGTVTDSTGTTTNTINQTTHYVSDQRFNVSATVDHQVTAQNTNITVVTSSRGPGFNNIQTNTLHYPLTLNYNFVTAPNGTSVQFTTVNQQYQRSLLGEGGGLPTTLFDLTNGIETADTLFFDSNFNVTGHKSQAETAIFTRTGTGYPCFQRKLVATSNVISAVKTGC